MQHFHFHPKKEVFLFDSFRLIALKNFITQGNRKIMNKILIGLDQIQKTQMDTCGVFKLYFYDNIKYNQKLPHIYVMRKCSANNYILS